MATTLTKPAEPFLILNGKAETLKPWMGSLSKLLSFSICE